MSREQQKSKTFKWGEGGPHETGKRRLFNILVDTGWDVYPDCIFDVEYDLHSQGYHKLSHNRYYHEWDIYATKKHDNGLTSEKIFEIDGTNKKGSHSEEVEKIMDLPNRKKKKQENRDRTAEEYKEFFLPYVDLYRVPIDELIGKRARSDAQLWLIYKLR